ncbi:uncharacterized protein LOC141845895 [Curcuma longa]|uniref:uncharacterized protein LOC141845895 n=1 Tax=Curcuma longa TaxID=136217 RepID=UPI003D9F40E9
MSTGGDDLGDKLPIEDENQEESETIACHVCDRVFMSKKALHGHMRSHPARRGCGSVTPSMEEETAESLLLLSGSGDPLHRKYLCHGCHEEFETREALEGHSASRRKRRGCRAKAKDSGRRRGGRGDDEAAESSRRGRKRKNKRPLFDLNKPPSPSSPSGSNDGSGGSGSSPSGEEEE